MKTLFKLLGVALLSATVLFTSCKDDKKDDNDGVTKPTNLDRAVSGSKVVFTWAGTADSYELKVNNDEYTANESTYTLNPLAVGSYTWSVRAIKGGETSEWVNGTGFDIKNEEIDETLTKVSGLKSEKIAATHAVVMFKRVSDISEYEVEMAGETVTVTYNENATTQNIYCYSPVALQTNTEYTWKVRYQKDGKYSEWSSSSFKTTASNDNAWWIKVTFERNGLKEYWETGSGEGQIIGSNDPDEEPLVLYDDATGYMVGHYQSTTGRLDNTESISPYRIIQFGMPCKAGLEGTYSVNADEVFVNYCEYSTLTYKPHDIQKMGNWFSTQDGGTFTLTKSELVTGSNGAKAYTVTGSYDVTTFDSKAYYGDQETIYGKLKVEFSGLPVMVD